MAKRHYNLCPYCGNKIKHKNFHNHLTFYHYIPYQKYLYEVYNLKPNYYCKITVQIWDFIYNHYQLYHNLSEDINQYYQRIFIENLYDANKLYPILGQYTKAIADYFNFSLVNAEQYTDFISLDKNINSTRSKYKDMPKSKQTELKRNNTRPKVKCTICGAELSDTSILSHVYNAHKILRKQYLQQLFNLPDELNYIGLTYHVAQKMYEELQKSPYDNYRDCYKALFRQYGSYEKMSKALGYNVKYACEGLNIAEPRVWTDKDKEAQRQRKLGKKWTALQRQKIIEGKLKSDKYKKMCGYTKEDLDNGKEIK